MTRSDLLLAVHRVQVDGVNADESECLVGIMHHKIENVYTILFALEKDPVFAEFAAALRKALES